MKKGVHILITGNSGSGKSYLSKFFRGKGKNAIDADEYPGLGVWVDKNGTILSPTKKQWLELEEIDFIWNPKIMEQLLSNNEELYLFGSSHNIMDFVKRFDKVFYLKIDNKLLVERLQKDREHDFGKDKKQLDKILSWTEYIDERARKSGFEIIDASLSPEQIFDIICKSTNK